MITCIRPNVEDGIPIPARFTVKNKWNGFLKELKPGQSFIARDAKERQSLYRCAEHAGISITTRQINGHGFRVWRIK